MSLSATELRALIAQHGPVARVVVADVSGSAPREVGASMCVWPDGQSGTIGGGALEFEASNRARAVLAAGADRVERVPLGPALAQCCGGNVALLTEIWTAARLDALEGAIYARPLPGTTTGPSFALRRILNKARGGEETPDSQLIDGWMIEPLRQPARQIWVFGAGHVGRALVSVLSGLPEAQITWVDTDADRFPGITRDNVGIFVATNPADAVRHAPPEAEHLVLTYSHAFDLEICHRLLGQSFRSAGLIGSATKWARFSKRLAALGHGPEQIARITCPIGDPSLGKHPQAIAIGVAAAMLRGPTDARARKDLAQ